MAMMLFRRCLFVVVALSVMAFALTVAERPQEASAHGYGYGHVVGMYDDFFWPVTVSVPVGATVTWVNYGHHHHTTTGDRGQWDSGVMDRGDRFSVRFARPGNYFYYCRIHPDTMRGMVHVGAVRHVTPTDFHAVNVSVTVFTHGAPRYGSDPIYTGAMPASGY